MPVSHLADDTRRLEVLPGLEAVLHHRAAPLEGPRAPAACSLQAAVAHRAIACSESLGKMPDIMALLTVNTTVHSALVIG